MPALGPFDLEALVARGGMGEVWRGRHREQGVPVAVKLLPKAAGRDPVRVAAFHNEARAAASLDHPAIVLLFDYGVDLDRPWIAMEHFGGGTLGEAAKSADWPEIRRALRAVLDALAHAHARGIVHRDVKSGNVLRDTDGRYKLADFGIARVAGTGDDGNTRSGTPSVMAPEQFEGRWRDFGPWTDLYALGALAWMLVTGHKPFPGRTRHEQHEGHLRRPLPPFRPRFAVPAGLGAWLARLLEKDPADRYRCAADAAWALASLGDADASAQADPAPIAEPTAATLVWEGTEHTSARTGSAWGDPETYRASVAPMPGRWAAADAAERAPALVGAGLGLWGLRTLRLVGRVQERDLLWARLAQVRRAGRTQAVVVRGAAGVGKSRLARWVAERARELGAATVLEASHDADAGPGSGLGAMVARHLSLAGLDDEAREARVAAILDRQLADDPDRWFARTLAQTCATDPGPPLERFAAIRRLLALVARERPVLLVLDDVQWGLAMTVPTLQAFVLTEIAKVLVSSNIVSTFKRPVLTRGHVLPSAIGQ